MAGWIKEISHPEFGIPVSYWECWSVFYDHQHQLSTLTVAGAVQFLTAFARGQAEFVNSQEVA